MYRDNVVQDYADQRHQSLILCIYVQRQCSPRLRGTKRSNGQDYAGPELCGLKDSKNSTMHIQRSCCPWLRGNKDPPESVRHIENIVSAAQPRTTRVPTLRSLEHR